MMNRTDFGTACATLQLAALQDPRIGHPIHKDRPELGIFLAAPPHLVVAEADRIARAAMSLHRLAERSCNGPEFEGGEEEEAHLCARQEKRIITALGELGLRARRVDDARSRAVAEDLSPAFCAVEFQGDPRGAAVKIALFCGGSFGVQVVCFGYGR